MADGTGHHDHLCTAEETGHLPGHHAGRPDGRRHHRPPLRRHPGRSLRHAHVLLPGSRRPVPQLRRPGLLHQRTADGYSRSGYGRSRGRRRKGQPLEDSRHPPDAGQCRPGPGRHPHRPAHIDDIHLPPGRRAGQPGLHFRPHLLHERLFQRHYGSALGTLRPASRLRQGPAPVPGPGGDFLLHPGHPGHAVYLCGQSVRHRPLLLRHLSVDQRHPGRKDQCQHQRARLRPDVLSPAGRGPWAAPSWAASSPPSWA